MTVHTSVPPKKPVFILAIVSVMFLYAGWTLAWLVLLSLKTNSTLLATPFAHFLYWTIMRIILWVLPPVLLLRRMGVSIKEAFSLKKIVPIVLWGGGAGLLMGMITLLVRLVSEQPLFSIEWGWPLMTAVILAPIVEEMFFRSAVMKAMETRFSFPIANLFSGVLFLLAHFPGWYFQGRLQSMVLSPVGEALGILLLGWLFGYIAHKSRFIPAAFLAHAMNNFFNA